METNRNESLNLGGREGEEISESRGENIVYNSEPDVTEGDVQPESPSNYLREVNIKPLDSGYLVKVGCQSVAVETTETLLKALGDYLNNPDSYERAWYKNKNRNKR